MLKDLGRARRGSTELEPIGGGRDFPRDGAARRALVARIAAGRLSAERAETLLDRYGTRALAVAEWCAVRQDQPLSTLPAYTRAEIGFLLENELVGRLTDLAFRRTDIALSGRLTPAVANELAEVAAAALGWDGERRAAERAGLARTAATRHGLGHAFSNGNTRQDEPTIHAAE
ncbi:MAG: hypothetical protein INR64_17485 [Caulobacteraceae bacterium]|nr:hypothetical protein [Caulobacter sp.]